MSTTALTIITTAFNLLNVFLANESVPAADGALGLTLLNNMMGYWGLQTLTIPANTRDVFPLIANKGGPSTPYTLGPGGNFDTIQSPSQHHLTGAGLLLNASTPPVEIPRAFYTDDAYQAIRVKDLQSTLFTGVYYNPTFAGGLATVNLWPVPNTALNSLVLYRTQQLGSFLSLTASYDLPLGYDEALAFNLAKRLCTPYGRSMTPEAVEIAVQGFAMLKRANMKMSDLPVDPMFLFPSARRPSYNIETGGSR